VAGAVGVERAEEGVLDGGRGRGERLVAGREGGGGEELEERRR